jgi:AraC-like DNA-binding protein
MTVNRHLILQEMTIQPSEEGLPRFKGWLMLRLFEGFGYWLQHGAAAVELKGGDGFILTGKVNGLVRASQLGPLKLQFFAVHPQYLTGVFTVAEWHQFEIVPNSSFLPVLFFRAAEPIGQKFSRIVGLSQHDRLPMRCALLQLWANAITDLLPAQTSNDSNDLKLRERFRHLVGQMPEVELYSCSPAELAQRLHCSKRHFYRLFREEFGVSLRTRQIESRSRRGSQLLVDSSGKTNPPSMSAIADNLDRSVNRLNSKSR